MYDISWKSEYTLGHSVLDKEHKYLFELAKEAFTPVFTELRRDKIKHIIENLNEYMKVHFSHEESFMQIIQYPYFCEHHLVHQKIICKMKDLVAKLLTLNTKEFEQERTFYRNVSSQTYFKR